MRKRGAVIAMTADFSRAWESAYDRRENFVFQPSTELVRFMSRHFRRRIGMDDYADVMPGIGGQPILDACCGIGRNLVFGARMGLDMHGFDLSARAVDVARDWLAREGVSDAATRTVSASIDALPFDDARFAHVMCEDALDSMPFAIAQAGVAEIARVVRPGGLIYCSVIGAEESGQGAEYDGEVLIEAGHERDTVQSYFTRAKLEDMLLPHFAPIAIYQIITRYFDPASCDARWYFIGHRR
jgi:ubiquinone/menaquinone biosynthesis C-methylase UbiE